MRYEHGEYTITLRDFLENTPEEKDICIGVLAGYSYFGKAGNAIKIWESFDYDETIFDRQIKDIFPRETDEYLAIILDGDEIGNSWFKEEYDKWFEKKRARLSNRGKRVAQ